MGIPKTSYNSLLSLLTANAGKSDQMHITITKGPSVLALTCSNIQTSHGVGGNLGLVLLN